MSDAMIAAASLYNDPRYFSRSEVRIRKNKIRRARIFRRQLCLLLITITLFLFVAVLLATTIKSDAQSDDFIPEFKYYKTVSVSASDSIWTIAKANYNAQHYDGIKEYISEICSINAISDPDRINAGESLIIPYYSSEYK